MIFSISTPGGGFRSAEAFLSLQNVLLPDPTTLIGRLRVGSMLQGVGEVWISQSHGRRFTASTTCSWALIAYTLPVHRHLRLKKRTHEYFCGQLYPHVEDAYQILCRRDSHRA